MRTRYVTFILMAIILYSITLTAAAAAPTPSVPPTITYIGHSSADGGVRFTYTVTAGSKPLNYWELTSSAFTHYRIIDASETAHRPDSKDTVRFTTTLKPGESRTAWFVLDMGYSNTFIGEVGYMLKSAEMKIEGTILGPVCPTLLMETTFPAAYTAAPLVVIMALASALRRLT